MLENAKREDEQSRLARTLYVEGADLLGRVRWRMIELVYRHGLTQGEVARTMGLPEHQVRADMAGSLQQIAALVCAEP